MASASSKSAKNLFADSKKRLSERVQVNVHNVGSVTRQVQRGSRASEVLVHTAKHFCHSEAVLENAANGLQKTQVLLAQIAFQYGQIVAGLDNLGDVKAQIEDLQR